MASLQTFGPRVRLLDAGAGVGALTLAAVEAALASQTQPKEIEVLCVESEPAFLPLLEENLGACARACARLGVRFSYSTLKEDFILAAAHEIADILALHQRLGRFTHAILNPPYKKLPSDSDHRRALREAGIETSNLYTAFVWLALLLLEDGGQLTAITPRSFCNGLYFRPFRLALRSGLALTHIHSIEERRTAFADDNVLQENIIFHGVKGGKGHAKVTLSAGDGSRAARHHRVPRDEVVEQGPDAIIHLVMGSEDADIREKIEALPCTLHDLGIEVSTGPVVDFRVKRHLRRDPEKGTAPLLYPCHFNGQAVDWPKPGHRKPNAIHLDETTKPQMLPAGHYTLVKRFTSKEQKKRLVAVVLSPGDLPKGTALIGIENHVNYFHRNRGPLDSQLARGLYCFLNSSLVDSYLRIFNGHTQINATDLRKLRYPSERDLLRLAKECWKGRAATQAQIDAAIRKVTGLASRAPEPETV